MRANAKVAAAMASPQVSAAPTGRRLPYAITPAMPRRATTKDITNATTRVGSTSLALGPSARHRRRNVPREISHILPSKDQSGEGVRRCLARRVFSAELATVLVLAGVAGLMSPAE